MKLGIGVGAFGLRAGVSTRGIGLGAGPFSVGHGWHSRRGRSAGGGSGCLGILAVLAVLGIIMAFLLWPYMLGAAIAVRLGAGNPSVARTFAGCLFEWPWLTLLIFLVVHGVRTKRPTARSRVPPAASQPMSPYGRQVNGPTGWSSGGCPQEVQPVPAARRSPRAESLAIAMAVAAVLVIVGGVAALRPNHGTAADIAIVPTSAANDDVAAETATPPGSVLEFASSAPATPAPGGLGDFGTDADRQGFVAYPAARCNSTNPAVSIGRTAESLVVICETGVGRLYYKGLRLDVGTSVEIDDPVRTAGGFLVTNAGVRYALSRDALVITSGATQLADEPMLFYWSDQG